MTTRQSVYDDSQWEVEPADPSTGIWTHTWAHIACEKEYEQGCEETSTLAGREVKNGMVYADETFTIVCLDCKAQTTFTDKTFMGFDGEQGV